MKSLITGSVSLLTVGLFSLFAVLPSSTNYTLKSYDIGSGGSSNQSSTTYRLNGISGTQSGTTKQTSTGFVLGDGLTYTSTSNVPPAPTFINPSSYYDRLKIVLNTGSNPTDTKYLIAISSDSFATTSYIQADTSVGSSQALTNYQTYAAWGGVSGFLVQGLTPATTYQIKVKALQGNFSGSAFGPTASASTVSSTLTFGLTTTLTSTPPYAVGFTSLTPGSVITGTADALIAISSNANNGGTIYVKGANGGLTSASAVSTITSATTNLAAASNGYGAQVTATGQASGGPLTSVSPYNGVSDNVGNLVNSLQPIVSTTGPITTGTSTIRFKAKADTTTPSAADYGDIVTLVVSMNF